MAVSARQLWRRDFSLLWSLAWPLAFVQLNGQLTAFVDTALAGRAGELALAATGLGSAVFLLAAVVGQGCALGTEPWVAQALGAGQRDAAWYWLWQGVYVALAVALPLWGVAWGLGCLLPAWGIEPELAGAVRTFLCARLPSLPPFCLVVVLRAYLQASRSARPVVISAVVMNIFNAVCDYVLLFGDAGLLRLGLPALGVSAMGVFGLGLASTLATFLQLGILLWAVRSVAPRAATRRPQGGAMLQVLRVGLPTGMQMAAEVGLFAWVGLLMGGAGTAVMAAHQAAITLVSCSFTVCVGIGSAASVQVGRAIGRGDAAAARRGGVLAGALGLAVMGGAALLMWSVPEFLLSWITSDAHVIASAAVFVRIAGFFQLVDGVQAVMSGALRGAGQTRWPFLANVAAYWGVGMPVGLGLAYGLGWGPQGLWWGLTAGLAVAAITLSLRFLQLSGVQPLAAQRI